MQKSPLGKTSVFSDKYNPGLLFAIPRKKELDEHYKDIIFYGYDIWNAYEISWLREDGKPEVNIAEIIYSCQSKFIVESKSLKLYLNSFNGTIFQSVDDVKNTIKQDLSKILLTEIEAKLIDVASQSIFSHKYESNSIDHHYTTNNMIHIKCDYNNVVTQEKIHTHLLKSNCPVTAQPDWATLFIKYSGPKIEYDSLLSYIISLRNENEFHEECIERIYKSIYYHCKPSNLEVYGRYNRRGGIDINPFRSSSKTAIPINGRTLRQ